MGKQSRRHRHWICARRQQAPSPRYGLVRQLLRPYYKPMGRWRGKGTFDHFQCLVSPFYWSTVWWCEARRDSGYQCLWERVPLQLRDASKVSGRYFPFGTWPLWWADDFMGSDEPGPHLDAIRPGGHVSFVELKTSKTEWGESNDTFFAIGDSQSLLSTLVPM